MEPLASFNDDSYLVSPDLLGQSGLCLACPLVSPGLLDKLYLLFWCSSKRSCVCPFPALPSLYQDPNSPLAPSTDAWLDSVEQSVTLRAKALGACALEIATMLIQLKGMEQVLQGLQCPTD